jgi:hypothetical protein
MPNFRIVKEYRNRNSKLIKYKFYIQKKWLFGWNEVVPYDIDSVFYGRGLSWDTFEEALEVYREIEEVLKIQRKKTEVVWPPPRREF